MADVRFLGACGTVTGSATLLSWGEARFVVDFGLYQGDEETKQHNRRELAFSPHELDAVVLTHAHLDHTGLLPRLSAAGFEGPIYCSKASRGLVSLILEDAGQLQEEAAHYARKKGYSRWPEPKPLYTSADARRTLRQLTPIPFGEEREICPGIRFRYHRAGHLLGAASIAIRAKDSDGTPRRWLFSGDVGRYDVPILKDPEPPDEPVDALVLESTYGDRDHDRSEPEEGFRRIIHKVFDRRGFVIIPAFALGRTQEVLYHLSALVDDGDLDPDDIFLDSPMALAATELYARATAEHDDELAELVRADASPLGGERFQRCRSVEQSKALNQREKPAVIVAASGMATGGRVVHHLKRRLGDPRNAVVFVGYQAAGTRGRALVNGAHYVAIHGEQVPVRAEIQILHGLSAHADRGELLRWCDSLAGPPGRIFLNHGEDPARKALAAALEAKGWPRPALPAVGTRVPF